jgi:RHS repeat-associated protein
MDALTYDYGDYETTGKNRLESVTDAETTNSYTPGDNEVAGGTHEFTYNDIGQITEDEVTGLKLTYNTSGLVKNVKDNSTNYTKVSFTYDQAGNRLKKTSYNGSGVPIKNTYYVRDASGTLMSIYEADVNITTGTQEDLMQTELPIYGAGSIGIMKVGLDGSDRIKLKELYALNDHLGNTRAVIEDEKDSYGQPILAEYADYYPFGSLMPGRSLTPTAYRYSYQSQEQDEETKYHSFQLRQYSSILGRWLTPDPYGQHWSPYLAMSNNPISFIDPDGGQDCQNCNENNITSQEWAYTMRYNRVSQQMNESYSQWVNDMNHGQGAPWYGSPGSLGGYSANNQPINWESMLVESYKVYLTNKNKEKSEFYLRKFKWKYDKETKEPNGGEGEYGGAADVLELKNSTIAQLKIGSPKTGGYVFTQYEYLLPVWGPCCMATDALYQERYGDMVGWWTIALIEGLTLGTSSRFRPAVIPNSAAKTGTSGISKIIDAGKQGKHIVGHNNYMPGKSILTENAQGLLDAFHSGNVISSQLINAVKTRVNFGKTIGYYIKDGVSIPTTNGIIINSKNGVHIVPSAP